MAESRRLKHLGWIVAAALVAVVPHARGRQLLESERMQGGRVAAPACAPSPPNH